jgi:hypothetical protein
LVGWLVGWWWGGGGMVRCGHVGQLTSFLVNYVQNESINNRLISLIARSSTKIGRMYTSQFKYIVITRLPSTITIAITMEDRTSVATITLDCQ